MPPSKTLAVAIGISGLCVALAAQPRGEPERRPDLGQTLTEGLLATEGCLGVDTGRFTSGKNVIVAWFENKAAVLRWYRSDVHQQFMGRVDDMFEPGQPLKHIEDENTPIMVVAAITMGGRPVGPPELPFSQISIEMYAPLPGGAMINGRLSPEAFPMPLLRDFTEVVGDGDG